MFGSAEGAVARGGRIEPTLWGYRLLIGGDGHGGQGRGIGVRNGDATAGDVEDGGDTSGCRLCCTVM